MVFFEIFGEQKTLTQWDVGRRMQVNAPCQQLHFANEGAQEAIVCPVQDADGVRTAQIPDELLQVSGTLWVYAYVKEEERYTRQMASFFVKERPKPAEYEYTPTQKVTLEDLAERVDALENREETDPTVPEWAKGSQKPAYTAAEIGAAPAGHVTDKNNPHAVTAAQVGARPASWMPSAAEVGAAEAPHTEKGGVAAAEDSAEAPFHGLKLYGKTVQNGVPTPESPVALESAGASGSIGVNVTGKNLLSNPQIGKTETVNGLTITHNADGSFTVNGTCTENTTIALSDWRNASAVPAGTLTFTGWGTLLGKDIARPYIQSHPYSYQYDFQPTTDGGYKIYELAEQAKFAAGLFAFKGVTYNNEVYKLQIEVGNSATAYEPYNGQNITASTPSGLPGIPVQSGGNYTDENGQQWVCDEVDFARGVYVQRVELTPMVGKTWWWDTQSASGGYRLRGRPGKRYNLTNNMVLCDKLSVASTWYYDGIGAGEQILYVRLPQFSDSPVIEDWYAYLEENPMLVLLALAEPIEMSLSAEEMAQYAALHTNEPNTTVFNDGGADMEVRYYTPDAAVPMNMGAGANGKVLCVDEHGCVVPMQIDTEKAVFVGDETTTIAEFREAYSHGKACFMRRSNAGEGYVTWVARSIASNNGLFYTVDASGNVAYGTLNNEGFVYQTSSGGECSVFVGDENTTVAEFYEAFQNRKACFMYRPMGPSGYVAWMMRKASTTNAFFQTIDDRGYNLYGILNSDSGWSYATETVLTEARVNELIAAALGT